MSLPARLFDDVNIKEISSSLPVLSQPISTVAGGNGLLKEIFFQVGESEDLIGVRIYENQERLSPNDWLKTKNDITPTTLSSLTVDGYAAGRGGQSTYVTALNVTGCLLCNKTIYTNEYILSLNSGASATAQSIYNSLVKTGSLLMPLALWV
jgi:hypothetical protein